MRGGTFVHCFGPFEFDPATGRLYHGSDVVRLPAPQSAMLRVLIAKAGEVVSKEALIEAGWATRRSHQTSSRRQSPVCGKRSARRTPARSASKRSRTMATGSSNASREANATMRLRRQAWTMSRTMCFVAVVRISSR
jgi:hypothetical protein